MKRVIAGLVVVMLVLSSVAAYAACGDGSKKGCCAKAEKKEGCPKADPNNK